MVTRTARRLPRRRPARRPRFALARPGMVSGRFLARRRLIRRFPTFVETFKQSAVITVPAAGVGGIFQVSMDQLPQLAQYQALYRQYKINWAQFTIIPEFNSYDYNSNEANIPNPVGRSGAPRIAWAITDTPGQAAPVTEQDLLEDNGSKFRMMLTRWSASCKPVPDQTLGLPAQQNVYMRRRGAPWLTFAAVGNQNPLHTGIRYWISQLSANQSLVYQVYVKVSFSLRDPQ